MHLGGKDDVVAPIRKRLPDDFFRLTVGVHVRGVDEVDAGIERGMDDGDAVVVVPVAPRAEHHGAETQRADLESGATQAAVLHVILLVGDAELARVRPARAADGGG